MRDHEKPRQQTCTIEVNVQIPTIQQRRKKELPALPEWIINIYDYADPKDAALCSLLAALD